MPSMDSVNEFARAQNEIVRLAKRDIQALRARVGIVSPMHAKRILMLAWPALVETYGAVAQALAGEWVESILGGTATLGELPNREQLEAVTRYGLTGYFEGDPGMTWARLAADLDRLVKAAARRTVMDSSHQDGVRWARVPVGDTCAFCRMLGARGYVYESAKTAGEMDDWHNKCDCQPTPDDGQTPAGYDPDALYEEYLAGRKAAGSGKTSNILAAMRESSDNPS